MTENFDERSAGGIVFREEDGKIRWLVIKTFSGKNTAEEMRDWEEKIILFINSQKDTSVRENF